MVKNMTTGEADKIEFDESVLKAMVELEGFTFEEAKLTYKAREKLPASVFCGANRTYPAGDAAHIKNGIARLMQFKPKGWQKILGCLCGRAKKAGIDSETCKKYNKGGFSESKIIEWYLSKEKIEICAGC